MTQISKVNGRELGLNFNGSLPELLIWAPLAETVVLQLADERLFPLAKQEHGYWYGAVAGLSPGAAYRILLDGQAVPDVTSLFQPEGVHGASQAVDLHAFDWSDRSWNNPPLKEYLLYELHTGTFSPEGTFEGLTAKLDHLVELGITAIELMPVAQFPGSRNWGYDGVYPFAVQNTYGGPAGLQQLIDVCHQKGIAVVLDVVYNHMGPEGNYLTKYGPYFTGKYQTPWGDALNFDDAGSDAVRRFFIENALMWFRDFHVDALRLDAVHAIKDFSPKHILRELKEHVNELIALTGRTHYLIVECDLNDKRFIEPLEKDGYGMDAQWIDEFHHALRVTAGGEKDGYYADFELVSSLAAAYEHAYVYHGQFSAHREKSFGTVTTNPGQQFIAFSQNHDQVGNRMLGERSSQLFSFEMQKLLAGAVLISPFLPLLFMGEEYSEQAPFQYFVSHSDPELIAAVQQGRKKEFAAFRSQGEAPDPQAAATFDRCKLQWATVSNATQRTMLSYYKAIIALRKRQPLLNSGNRENMKVVCDEGARVITVSRWQNAEQLICFLNFSRDQQKVLFTETGEGRKLFDSAAEKWNGPAAAPEVLTAGTAVVLQPESITIYSNAHV
jgi:maltooligosyltrehalose trehalohydrolase